MNSPFANPTFRHLFAAQGFSLLGVGLLTVALSLSAYRIGGVAAGGQVLGFLLALKMVAYVVLAPPAEMLLSTMSRKHAMVALNFGRMLLLPPMALVTEMWQVAALAFAFFALSAGFTPLFQSVIPDVLPDEKIYSKALAWSRIAYTLEAVLSPVVAAMVLNLVTGDALFNVAALAFLGSVLALCVTHIPARAVAHREGTFLRRAGYGLWIYWQTPRLSGLFLLNLALSLAMAWVLVNSVVYAGARLGDAERYYPILMTSYGVGAAIGAFAVPQLLRRLSERAVIVLGVFGFAAIGAGFAVLPYMSTPVLASVWTTFGVASSLALTPGGLVITRSVTDGNRAAAFAAQFSLSHAGWLVAYPLSGWLVGHVSLEFALLILSVTCAVVASAAIKVWPADDPLERPHSHPELPFDHPHLKQVPAIGAVNRHVHAFRIDKLHPNWIQKPTKC